MQSIELTAKNVEEAKQMAAERLGVSADQVQVSVLEETKGLFGKSQVRVKAEAAAPAPAPAAAKPARAAKAEPAPAPAEVKAEEPKKDRRIGAKKAPKKAEEAAPAPAPVAEAPVAAAAEESNDGAPASDDDAEAIVAVLRDLLESANMQVNAKIKDISGRYVSIQLDGRDAAFLVGKHGEVLNALQYLLNIICSRKVPNGVRATLDANDYRRRREEALTKLATKIAEQVSERQEEAVLDALPAFERRIVHKALSTIPGVQTYSEGEEPNRRVVIAPAD